MKIALFYFSEFEKGKYHYLTGHRISVFWLVQRLITEHGVDYWKYIPRDFRTKLGD